MFHQKSLLWLRRTCWHWNLALNITSWCVDYPLPGNSFSPYIWLRYNLLILSFFFLLIAFLLNLYFLWIIPFKYPLVKLSLLLTTFFCLFMSNDFSLHIHQLLIFLLQSLLKYIICLWILLFLLLFRRNGVSLSHRHFFAKK